MLEGTSWIQAKDWVLFGLIAFLGTSSVAVLVKIFLSIQDLNAQVASLITNGLWYKEKFEEHDAAIEAHSGILTKHGEDLATIMALIEHR